MRKLAILLLAFIALAGTSAARTHRKLHKSKQWEGVSRARAKRYRAPKRVRTRPSTYQHSAPRSQQGPSPDRYKEIQQALTDKGYYKGDVNGTWSTDSTEALRRFQSDQNLKVDGKIGSLSLIALGLGPKRTLSAQAKPSEPRAVDGTSVPVGVPE